MKFYNFFKKNTNKYVERWHSDAFSDRKTAIQIFKDVKNGVPKVISFFAKWARGMMSKYIIKNRVQSIEDLHSFNDNGYEFQPDQSDNHELVYIRG